MQSRRVSRASARLFPSGYLQAMLCYSSSEKTQLRTNRSITLHPSIHTHIAMFRAALAQSLRRLPRTSTRAQQPIVRRAIASPFISSRISSPAFTVSAARCYSSASGLGQEEVTGRIVDLLKNFDKVWWFGVRSGDITHTDIPQVSDPSKVRLCSHYQP